MVIDLNKAVQEMHHDMLVFDLNIATRIFTGVIEPLVLSCGLQTAIWLIKGEVIMSGRSYVGNIGLPIYADCEQDVSAATGLLIKYKKPDGTTGEWSATLYGTEYIQYTIQAGDFDQDGEYKVQPFFTLGSWVGRGKTASFTVYPIFALFKDEV